MINEKGQIVEGQQLCEILKMLARRQDFKTYVEIGTWRGQGSTKCIGETLIMRNDDSRLYSVEMRKDMHREAMLYWNSFLLPMPFKRDKINLLNGVIVEAEDLMTVDEFTLCLETLGQSERLLQYKAWHKEMFDGLTNKQWPNVIEQIPKDIDFLLLDSGELTSVGEFKNLTQRGEVKFVILDDVYTVKNFNLHNELCKSKDWNIIELVEARHGYSAFVNANYKLEIPEEDIHG